MFTLAITLLTGCPSTETPAQDPPIEPPRRSRPGRLQRYAHNGEASLGAGSCGILHLWRSAEQGTYGCTTVEGRR